jgi:hypothetical protein
VSRRDWRCRRPACPVPHGAVLGRLSLDGSGLVLDPAVDDVAVYLDAGRAAVRCPACGAVRDFRGGAVRLRPGGG